MLASFRTNDGSRRLYWGSGDEFPSDDRVIEDSHLSQRGSGL
jgi:hypothetical protein